MQEIIAEAQALGKKIAEHPRCATFLTASRAVAADQDAQDILRGFQEHAQKMQQLQQAGKTIEVEDKQKLSEFEQKVAGNDLLKDMLKAQTDYIELMNGVNQGIEQAIQEAATKA